MFAKTKIKTIDDEVLFELSNDISIILHLNDPPFSSRLVLEKNSSEIMAVSVSFATAEKIQNYAKTMVVTSMENSNSVIELLTELKLKKFVSEVETALQYTDMSP